MILSDAIKEFNEWRQFKTEKHSVQVYGIMLKNFAVFMRDCHIEEVTEKHIVEWFTLLKVFEGNTNTCTTRAIAIRKLFEFHHKKGLKVLDPWFVPVPRKLQNMPRVISKKDYLKLLAAIPKNNHASSLRDNALIRMYWDTVARNTEILTLGIGDIQTRKNGGKAIIRTEKSRGKRPFREIFWGRETHAHLKRWLKKRNELQKTIEYKDPDAIFICCSNRFLGMRLSSKGVGEMLGRYSKKAGIEKVNAHSIRHRGCRDIVKTKGAHAVMNIAGHASLASSSIYTMLFGEELEELHNGIKR